MNDCRLGFRGVQTNPECPARSSFIQRIHSGGEFAGILAVHYLSEDHNFTDSGIDVMKTVAVFLGLMIGRVKEKKAEIARIEAGMDGHVAKPINIKELFGVLARYL